MSNETEEFEEISLVGDDPQQSVVQVAIKTINVPEIYEVVGEFLPFDDRHDYL
jgi:hypothetical protein